MNNDPYQPNPPQDGGEPPQVPVPQPEMPVQPEPVPMPEPVPAPTPEYAPSPAPEPLPVQPPQYEAPPVQEQPYTPIPKNQPIERLAYPAAKQTLNVKNIAIAVGAVLVVAVVIVAALVFMKGGEPESESIGTAEVNQDQEFATTDDEIDSIKNTIMKKWDCTRTNIDSGEESPDGPAYTIEFNQDWTFSIFKINDIANFRMSGAFKLMIYYAALDGQGIHVESDDDQTMIGILPNFAEVVTDGVSESADTLAEMNESIGSSGSSYSSFMTIIIDKELGNDKIGVLNNGSLSALNCSAKM